MRRSSLLSLGLGLALVGCQSYGDGTGAGEPITVSNATFNEGALPKGNGPALPLAAGTNGDALAGGPEKSLGGLAPINAYGIAVRMKHAGSGYWVVPVGLPDLNDVGTLDWALKFRFTRDAPLGEQLLQVASTDKDGKLGKISELKFTIKSMFPAGKKVISLLWNNKADLDLHVVGPEGKTTTSRRPNTGKVPKDKMIPEGGIEGSGTLSRDSNPRCAFDGFMQEDVVFTGDADPGEYAVWVDLFDSCGEPATTFSLELREDGDKTYERAGQLLDINADNGTGPGLFIHTFEF